MGSIRGLVLFFKIPEKGKVKTRLSKVLGKTLAQKIYQGLLRDTIKKAESLEEVDLYAFYTGKISSQVLKEFQCKKGWKFIPQEGENLGERLKRAGELLFALGYKELLFIGADCPYLDKFYLSLAFKKLQKYSLVLGPAYDGGYVLLGLREDFKNQLPLLFDGLPFETPFLLNKTLERLPKDKYFLLPPLGDIDTIKDLLKYLISLCKGSKTTTTI